MIRTPSICGTIGFELAKVCKSHRVNVATILAEVGLHVGQDMLLAELWEQDGLRGGELAVRLNVEPPTVTKMLRRLQTCGLVERRQNPDDARSFRVHLTDKGRALRDPVAHCWQRAEEKTLASLNPKERQTLHGLLTKIRGDFAPGSTGE
ncbi:MAG: winged helix-turn-helix transcriptional regulator [Rubrobacter sp.]|jgi:DNA-binding MarR family transcriptional regulator|nr:winged helix-turn-helix transcriptional regulator [Rubrobacter sp.]